MNIHLGKELEAFITQEVQQNLLYNNVSEWVREAIREKIERNREYQQRMAELRQSIDAGWQQAEHGELVDFEPDKILNRVMTKE